VPCQLQLQVTPDPVLASRMTLRRLYTDVSEYADRFNLYANMVDSLPELNAEMQMVARRTQALIQWWRDDVGLSP